MTRIPSALEDALAELIAANDAARARLEASKAMLLEATDMLHSGTSVPDTIRILAVHDFEVAAIASMNELMSARRKLRRIVVGAAVEAGMPLEELASMFEVRPDLLASYVAEQAHRT